jgi:predicted RNA methylase
MLQDVERINAYRLALSGLSDKKVVIDVGAGTGILSMIAMDYGATCVYAIEKSEICQVAISNIQRKPIRSEYLCINALQKISLLALKKLT